MYVCVHACKLSIQTHTLLCSFLNVQGSLWRDCAAAGACLPCTLAQMKRELPDSKQFTEFFYEAFKNQNENDDNAQQQAPASATASALPMDPLGRAAHMLL